MFSFEISYLGSKGLNQVSFFQTFGAYNSLNN